MRTTGLSLGAILTAIVFNVLTLVPVVVAGALLLRWIMGVEGRPGLAAKLASRLEARRAARSEQTDQPKAA